MRNVMHMLQNSQHFARASVYPYVTCGIYTSASPADIRPISEANCRKPDVSDIPIARYAPLQHHQDFFVLSVVTC
jgi:hypothetical protein